uniref:Transmembrane protein n=1 Tax=Spyridia filamentosa TaxID=196632 RepID=A0A1Z1MKA8_SPYFI|nr:hypothetical protein [Spyridia filamentosa]ARW66194.1 hypothetical protein [Spyridia filamentosa]
MNSIPHSSLHSQYLISPTTWIHNISFHLKILFIILIFIIVPYLQNIHKILTVIISYQILLSIIFKYSILIERIKIVIYILCFNCIIYFYNIHENIDNLEYVYLQIPMQISCNYSWNITNCTKSYIKNIEYQHDLHKIEAVSLQIIYLTSIYWIFNKILVLTTKYENILSFYFHFILNNSKLLKWKKVIFIASISSQLLDLIIITIYKIHRSFKIRYTTKVEYQETIKLLIMITKFYLYNNLNKGKILSYILYSKEIHYQNFYFYKLKVEYFCSN